ncbi:hypothetical protein ACIQWN_38665 [Streptomyces vinaceus]
MNISDLFAGFDIHIDAEEIAAELPFEDAEYASVVLTTACSGAIC